MWGAVFNGTADLTTHGAAVLESHGAYYARETWSALVQQQQGGSQAGGDPCSQVTFYADPDPDTHRDRETARHFLRGMLPQCDPDAVVQNNRELRAVFNQGAPSHFTARFTPAGCPSMPPKTVVDGAVTGNDIQKFTQAHGEMIRALSDAVGCCKAEVCVAHGATPDWARTGAASSPTHAGPSPADASSLATLDLDAGPYLTGVPLVVTYSHATDAHNWVGLYRAHDTPGREEDWSHHWDYVPSPGTGTVRFTATVAGRYYLTMFAGGSATMYTELTERLYIEVHDGPQSVGPAGSNASLAGLRVGAGPHVAGRPLTVTFTGATDGHDWVGIYKDGHTPGDQQPGEWHYHGSVAGSGSVMVTPTSAGRYFIVLFCCNGFLEKTGRLEITVKAPCSLLDLNTPSTAQFNPVHYWSLYNGTLALSASIAEYLQLLYLNGMDARAVAPGMSEAEIARFVELHQLNMGFSSGTPWVARAFGSDLLAHLAATFEQLTATGGGAAIGGLGSRPTDKLVYYAGDDGRGAGHDINIYFVRVLLGLHWLTESFNGDQSPPGGFLRFELCRQQGAGQWFVKVFFESMSMSQQRDVGRALDARDNRPDRVFVAVPGCTDGPESSCPLQRFKHIVFAMIEPNCVETVKAWADSNLATG